MNIKVIVPGNGKISLYTLRKALPDLEKIAKEPPIYTKFRLEDGNVVEISPDNIEREVNVGSAPIQYIVCDHVYLNNPKPGKYLLGYKEYFSSDLELLKKQ